MMKTLAKIGAVLSLLPIAAGVWWFALHVAQAEDQVEEQGVLKEAVLELKAIHTRQATVEEAEAALIAELCRKGKLKGDECPAVPTPAPAPTVEPE